MNYIVLFINLYLEKEYLKKLFYKIHASKIKHNFYTSQKITFLRTMLRTINSITRSSMH